MKSLTIHPVKFSRFKIDGAAQTNRREATKPISANFHDLQNAPTKLQVGEV